MKKRLLSTLLVLCMALGLCSVPALALDTSGTCGDGLTWSYSFDDGTLTIQGTGSMNAVPWYNLRNGIYTVKIGNGVTSIGENAFNKCNKLTNVTIPDSVTSIEYKAFSGCSSLTRVTIPNSVNSIGEFAFEGCSSLTSITIPDSITSIERGVFSSCSLTSVTIPNSVTTIKWGAFSDCSSLKSVTIPNSVTTIEKGAFSDCSSLTSVTIPNSVTSIGAHAFENCRSLTSVIIPDSTTTLNSSVFKGCESLTSVTIPDSVTSIGESVFEDCKSLTSVTIPIGVTSIEWWAFSDTGLKDVYYGGNEIRWEVISFGRYNTLLRNATIHYNSTGPAPSTSDGNSIAWTDVVGGFGDVKGADYFADAVLWAVEKGITSGTSKTTFSPGQDCTVAQILTFLWRASGSPDPAGNNPFSDVSASDYYYKAALWAAGKGMVSGRTFGGNTPCTRSMAVTYMWKAAGSPSAKAASFTDVPVGAEYAQAVAWAVEQGVTAGTSITTFSPDSVCTRGQIVTFLYRGLAK